MSLAISAATMSAPGAIGRTAARSQRCWSSTIALLIFFAAAPAAKAEESRAARADHPLVLSVNAGWNTIAGLGVEASLRLREQFYLDAGAGCVVSGPKGGARLRWNLSDDDGWTPFASAGVVHSLGPHSDQHIDGSAPFTFRVGPETWAQLVVGFDGQDHGDRWVWRWELGWAQPLYRRELRLIAGQPSDADWTQVKLIAAGGLVVGVSVGYAF
jgi:hypothetical protein